jgi:hypothetical protein
MIESRFAVPEQPSVAYDKQIVQALRAVEELDGLHVILG